MNFDIEKIPFSMKGSYIAVSYYQENACNQQNEAGVYLRSIHGLTYLPNSTMLNSPPFCARIEPVCGNEKIAYEVLADEAEIRMITDHGELRMCFADADTLLLQGTGIGLGADLKLIDGNYAHVVGAHGKSHILMNCGRSSRRFLVRNAAGSTELEQENSDHYCNKICFRGDQNGVFLAGIEDVVEEWKPENGGWCYEQSREERRQDFLAFLRTAPEVPEEYEETRKLAAYINWSGVVKKEGILTRDAMLMAKNWMCNVWSWDHCFNAIALSYHNPALAWDQFMLMFDFQGETGRIPDCVSDTYAIWNFCKPPVHGWALAKMMKVMQLTGQQYQEAYERLKKWTNWWLTWRDEDGDGICEYHHGNDAGWDNSTVFRKHPVMELPDLAAFLIIQMDVLKDLAVRLNLAAEAEEWGRKSDNMLAVMLKHCFDGRRPIARISRSHEEVVSDSLILYLPILLGKKLPAEIREHLIGELKGGRFLTAHGFATEAVNSPYYDPDGYWRGPIWAPSTLLLVEGLSECGEKEFAAKVAECFCDMVRKNGCAENFNALTGEGLRDKAYTWTSSVFLILAHEYL